MTTSYLLFQENHVTSREHAARRLRDLADKIEASTFELGDHDVALPTDVEFKVAYDREHDTRAPSDEFQFEPSWNWAGSRGLR